MMGMEFWVSQFSTFAASGLGWEQRARSEPMSVKVDWHSTLVWTRERTNAGRSLPQGDMRTRGCCIMLY